MAFIGSNKTAEQKSTRKSGSNSYERMFKLYARYDDQTTADSISLKSIEMWLKEVNVLDDKKVTKDDISSCFGKIAKDKNSLSMKEFEVFLCQLADDKGMDKSKLMEKVATCDQPNQEDLDSTPISDSCEKMFKLYARYDAQTNDDSISLKSIEKWLKEVNVLDGKKVTKDDLSSCFYKIAKDKTCLSIKEFEEFLSQLAADKGLDKYKLMKKITCCDQPNQEDVDDCGAGKSEGGYQVTANATGSCNKSACDDKHMTYMPKEAGNIGNVGKDTCDDKNIDSKPQGAGNVPGNMEKDIFDVKNKTPKPQGAGNVPGNMEKDICDVKNKSPKPQVAGNVSENKEKDISDEKNKYFKKQQ